MINGFRNRKQTNELGASLFPNQSAPSGDYIGFNPTQNQSEYGTPQRSSYGAQVMETPRYGILDYFPSFPFRGVRNYVGSQGFGHPVSEMLYARTNGYRGILPINQLPIIQKPYPFDVPLYEQYGNAD